jgi:hypothetical protein
MTTKHTFEVRQGAAWSWELSNFGEDISGDVFLMQVRAGPDRSSDLLLDVTPYIVVSSDKISVSVPSSVTELLDFEKGFYDLFWNDIALLYGCVSLSKQVTDTRE